MDVIEHKPDDHEAYRALDLTKPGCDCPQCEGIRDRTIIARSRFGEESDEALAAMARRASRRHV